jgi:ethanolamine utilization protein EutN
MYIGTVVGNAVATSKVEKLTGKKFLLIRPGLDELHEKKDELYVAVDSLGAGIGEKVLIVTGSAARVLDETKGLPIDAVVVGIINDYDLRETE